MSRKTVLSPTDWKRFMIHLQLGLKELIYSWLHKENEISWARGFKDLESFPRDWISRGRCPVETYEVDLSIHGNTQDTEKNCHVLLMDTTVWNLRGESRYIFCFRLWMNFMDWFIFQIFVKCAISISFNFFFCFIDELFSTCLCSISYTPRHVFLLIIWLFLMTLGQTGLKIHIHLAFLFEMRH